MLNMSGSGEGSQNGTPPAFQPFFPCRMRPFSTNTTSPFIWGILPDLHAARPYVATVEAFFIVVGVIWNLFVLIIYCVRPRLLKEPANIYLFNLAMTDFLLSIFITFTSFLTEATGEFIFGSSDFVRCNYCLFLGVALHTFISLSLHTLAALSVDRFVILFRPMSYKSIFNWKKAIVIQICLWVLSIVISIPPIFGFGEFEFNLAIASCNARWSGTSYRDIENINYVIFFGVEALFPIILLTFTNIWIIKIVRSFLKRRIARRRTYRGENDDNSYEEEKQYQQQQQQLIRVFGALFVAHIVCWTPVLTASFVALGIGATKIPVEIFVFGWLAYLSIPVIHPILESFFIKDLRYRIQKTKKKVKMSIRKASGSFYSQVSNTSLARNLSRRLSSSELPKLKRNNTSSSSSQEPQTNASHKALSCVLSSTSTTSHQTVAHTLSSASMSSNEMSKVNSPLAKSPPCNSVNQIKEEDFCGSPPTMGNGIAKKSRKNSTVSFKLDSPERTLDLGETAPGSLPPSITESALGVDMELCADDVRNQI